VTLSASTAGAQYDNKYEHITQIQINFTEKLKFPRNALNSDLKYGMLRRTDRNVTAADILYIIIFYKLQVTSCSEGIHSLIIKLNYFISTLS
jgi:hypothetical protein